MGRGEWDMSSSRAFAPTLDMVESPAPVLGTIIQALASPCPLGIELYSVDSKEARNSLPLYYVSPKMELDRGGDVRSGWYVVAVPETEFEVSLTNIQSKFPSVKGKNPGGRTESTGGTPC